MLKLENKIVPWQKRGRWYRFFIESDGTDFKITSGDLESTIASGYLKLPKKIHALDYIIDINNTAASNRTFAKTFKTFTAGEMGVLLPDVRDFDYMYVYVFGYFD